MRDSLSAKTGDREGLQEITAGKALNMNGENHEFDGFKAKLFSSPTWGPMASAGLRRWTGMSVRLAFLVAFISPCCMPQQLSVSDILNKIGETYEQLRSYQVSAEMVTKITAGEVRFNEGQADDSQGPRGGVMYASSPTPELKSEVELAVTDPGKYRLQVKDSSSEILVISDGVTTWTYSPKKREYTEKFQSPPSGKNEKDAASVYENTFVTRYRNLAKYSSSFTLEKDKQIKIGPDKIDCYVLKLKTPKGVHEIWVDKVRFVVWHSMDSDPVDPNEVHSAYMMKGVPYQKTLTVDLKKAANFNAKLEDGLFAFVPPDKTKKVESLSPQKK